jgi:hypothetical protein
MNPLANNVYSFNFTDTSLNGIYTWSKIYANDTAGNVATSSPNLQFTVLGITYNINGVAIDSTSGAVIQSGTVTAIIQESGDNGTVSFTNGNYTIPVRTFLLANQTTFHVGIIITGTGKTGYNYLTIGNGPPATQTATCTTKQWHFTGTALDQSGNSISSSTISVSVEGVSGTNSTTFSNGVWDIYISPCLISGGLYNFQFALAGISNTALFSRQIVAK